jgi:hypothetical protein
MLIPKKLGRYHFLRESGDTPKYGDGDGPGVIGSDLWGQRNRLQGRKRLRLSVIKKRHLFNQSDVQPNSCRLAFRFPGYSDQRGTSVGVAKRHGCFAPPSRKSPSLLAV